MSKTAGTYVLPRDYAICIKSHILLFSIFVYGVKVYSNFVDFICGCPAFPIPLALDNMFSWFYIFNL